MDTVGKNIRKYRMAQHLRQEDLAEKAELSANFIGMVERGEKMPSLETFVAIADALDVSADVLLADVLHKGYQVKTSLLAEKLEDVSPEERARIYDVLEVLLHHAKKE